MVDRRQSLNTLQLDVLRWIADGCPDGVMQGHTYKRVALALQDRRLVTVSKKGGVWRAAVTNAGVHYAEHERYPDPPPEPAKDELRNRSGKLSAERAMMRARAMDEVAAAEEVRSPGGKTSRPAAAAPAPRAEAGEGKRESPMRYRVAVTRVQVSERFVRAADIEDAAKKVQAELDRPYGFMGAWRTIDSDMDVQETEEALRKHPGPLGENVALVLSVKDAAAYLGVTRSVMYELVNTGEIGHLPLGQRKMIPRRAIEAFVEANTRGSGMT